MSDEDDVEVDELVVAPNAGGPLVSETTDVSVPEEITDTQSNTEEDSDSGSGSSSVLPAE